MASKPDRSVRLSKATIEALWQGNVVGAINLVRKERGIGMAERRSWSSAKLTGYAILGEDPSFDCQVLPNYEGAGIEVEALAWAKTRLSELRKRDAQRWGGHLVSAVRQDDEKRITFLEQHGFRRGEYSEVNMLRRLDEPIPDCRLPEGCQVRSVNANEISDRAAAQREVWQPWTVGDVSDEEYARFMRLPGYQRDLDIVSVTPQGVIAAYVNGWIDPLNRIGDFGPVGALPAYRRRGLTRASLLESLRRMRAYRMDRVCISTGVSNTPAIYLYESIGFRIVNRYFDFVKTRNSNSPPRPPIVAMKFPPKARTASARKMLPSPLWNSATINARSAAAGTTKYPKTCLRNIRTKSGWCIATCR